MEVSLRCTASVAKKGANAHGVSFTLDSISPSERGGKRKMIHIPQALERTAGQWVATYQEAWQLMERISQICLDRFFREKERQKERRR